jgi:LysM repeat protein
MSQSQRSSAGRWIWSFLILAVVSLLFAVGWRRGFELVMGPPPSDPVEARRTARVVDTDPELDPELVAAQFEPDLEMEDEADEVEPLLAFDGERRPRREPVDGIDDDLEEVATVISAGYEEDAATTARDGRKDHSGKAAAGGSGKTAVIAGRNTETSSAAAGEETTTSARGTPLLKISEIDALEARGELIEAQLALSRWYWRVPAERERLMPRLNKLAQSLYFSPQPHFYEPYVVKSGDQLRVVSQQYKLSWEYLAKLNRVDARKIRMGQRLKVVPGPFAAMVTLGRYELVLHLNGSFVKSYRVGIGKDGTTPVGTFTVKNKMADPTYYGPEGVISHDDPTNPLGERWIDIGDSYGIHGTIDPDSIGKSESRGCIRLLNSDAEEVYDFLVIGSEVKIQR